MDLSSLRGGGGGGAGAPIAPPLPTGLELVRASNLSVETSSPSGCDTGQCLFVCVGKETLKNLMTFQMLSIIL